MAEASFLAPLSRIQAGTASQLQNAYHVVLCTAANTSGFFVGPVTLPDWVDVSYPIRAFLHMQQLNALINGQTVAWEVIAYWMIDGASNGILTNRFTQAIPSTGQGFLQRHEVIDDNYYPDPLYPAATFPYRTSVGFRIVRLGNDATDNYGFTVSLATYLELRAHVRCQVVQCAP